jgi:acetyl esterase/lipase
MHRRVVRFGIAVVTGVLAVMSATALAPANASASVPSLDPGNLTAIPYGPEPYQVLDLQLPDAAGFPHRRPLIVYVHAGGWIAGDRSAVPDAAVAQVARGYAVASVDYRLATLDADGRGVTTFPGAIWDVKRAIRFLKANAATWNLDPRRLVLMGASAGGYLAAFVGATNGEFEPPDLPTTPDPRADSSVKGIVDFVGPTDLMTFARTDHPWAAPLAAEYLGCPAPTDTEPMSCADELLRSASVETYVDRTDPPIYLAYGGVDSLVVAATQGESLARAWMATHPGNAGGVSYNVIDTAGHNLPYGSIITPLDEFVDRVTRIPLRSARL